LPESLTRNPDVETKIKIMNAQSVDRKFKDGPIRNHGRNIDSDRSLFLDYPLGVAVDAGEEPIMSGAAALGAVIKHSGVTTWGKIIRSPVNHPAACCGVIHHCAQIFNLHIFVLSNDLALTLAWVPLRIRRKSCKALKISRVSIRFLFWQF
jgi:hypothetical protein